MGKIETALRRHPLFETLLDLRGNPRACVYTEPLWGIPYNLYNPFATLFMYELGIQDRQIGMILTFGMVLQVFAALLGGIVTDKLGRRKTTFFFDFLSWSVTTLIWTFSQNAAWFFVAAIFNCMWQITDIAWNSLLVEDCDPKIMVNVYTWVSVSGLLAVFFAPLSGYLVAKYSLIPTMRALYFFTFLMMTSKFVILYFCSTETQQGKKRLEETKGVSVFTMLRGYKDVFLKILRTPATLLVLFLKTLFQITVTITGSFFSLYVTKNIGIPEQYLSYFPMVRAAVVLVFLFVVTPKLNLLAFKPVMVAGSSLYLFATAMLIFSSRVGPVTLIFYVLGEAFAYALIMPRQDSLFALFIEPQDRARITGLICVIMIGLSSPFGAIAGFLSDKNRVYPFLLNFVLFAVYLLLILFTKPIQNHDRQEELQN